MIWGGNEKFKTKVIKKLKESFMFGNEEPEAFTYTGIQLREDT